MSRPAEASAKISNKLVYTDLVLGLNELAVPLVPGGSVQEQAVHIHTLGRLLGHGLHVLKLGHLIVQDDSVKGPTLVVTCHFLEHK